MGEIRVLVPPNKPQRVVKPRKKHTQKMPIAVCDSHGKVWYEGKSPMGNANWDLIEFVRYMRENWPRNKSKKKRTVGIMLVCHNPHKIFNRVHEHFANDPEWNARFSVANPDKYHLDGTTSEPKVKNTRDIRVMFFGFRSEDRHTQYFHPISPYDFMDDFKSYGDLDLPEYIRLYKWAGNIRQWIVKNGLKMSPSRGGLSAQLLRDKRFYPQTRRKSPKQTNEKARPALPGNFYAITEQNVGRLFGGVYVIDQENAHHYAAELVTLPNVNSLFAYGRFLDTRDKPYTQDKEQRYNELLGEHGLFRVRLWVPKGLTGMLPQWAMRAGLVNAWLFSNELELCQKLGIEIRHIAYAFTSPDTDSGLTKYAEWAQSEIRENQTQKAWLKPVLLSAYGILGARPRRLESAYVRAERGEDYTYLLGPYPVKMQRILTKKEIQTPIANTIHRGMIEAETRRLSIEMARKLEREGNNVIAVHADAVLIQDEGQTIPLLHHPWRIKDRLGGFKALDRVSYESDTISVLPGRKRAKQ